MMDGPRAHPLGSHDETSSRPAGRWALPNPFRRSEVQIAGTVASTLYELAQNQSGEYSSKREALKAALIQLSHNLHKLNQRESYGHDQQADAEEIRGLAHVLVKTRISVSVTYSVVHKLKYDPPDLGCCYARVDQTAEDLDKQLIETRKLVDAIAIYARGLNYSAQESDGPLQEASGVSCLTLTTPERLDSKIREGKTVELPLWAETADGKRVVYIAKTWISNPNSWFQTAKRLSASLEILHAGEGASSTLWDIRLPEHKDRSVYPREHRAFLTSSGVLQAEVTSVLRENYRTACFGLSRLEGAGTLLQRDHSETESDVPSYVAQTYTVQFRAATKAFDLGLGLGGLGQFRLKGLKEEYKTYYECFVEATGEVLAIYLHRRRQHFGVVRFIGPGNHPELLDLIMGAMVAMGLDSQL